MQDPDDQAFRNRRSAAYEYFGFKAPNEPAQPPPTMDELILALHEKLRELETRIAIGEM
jgi:hypothetical protein